MCECLFVCVCVCVCVCVNVYVYSHCTTTHGRHRDLGDEQTREGEAEDSPMFGDLVDELVHDPLADRAFRCEVARSAFGV